MDNKEINNQLKKFSPVHLAEAIESLGLQLYKDVVISNYSNQQKIDILEVLESGC